MNNKRLTYISLFSGAGVGCYGFKTEDFECIATAEIIKRRLDVQKFNNICKYATGYIYDDLKLPQAKDKIFKELERWNKTSGMKNLDVLIATPPCQGMSVANLKKKNEIGRNSLVVESIELTLKINPKVFIFENVRSFLTTICTDLDGQNKSIRESIEENLSGRYNILYRVINFKDYGSPSSRTRTLVIGVRKDLWEITPYDLFPDRHNEQTLRKTIGDLPSLSKMGEIYPTDIYHSFRTYPEYMLDWIRDLKEGESAFDNTASKKIPYQVVSGKIVPNQNKNGDKYRRWYWDKVAPCIHTRNDQLASQCTIHPKDNRVFSIRELMRMMSIPDTFKWVDIPEKELNKLDEHYKRMILTKHEMNIRQCIGEAVPTIIFKQIAIKIKEAFSSQKLNEIEAKRIIGQNKLEKVNNLLAFLKKNLAKYSYAELSKIAELANAERLHNAAFYTRQDICFTIIKDLPNPENFKSIRILEPAVGVGNFIPLIIKKYQEVPKVTIDVVDIDKHALEILTILLKRLTIPKNIMINFFLDDFLLRPFNGKYDIVIGNPPYKKLINNKQLLSMYKEDKYNSETNNLFSFFIEKSLQLGNYVSLIVPKSLLSTPEFNKTREFLKNFKFIKITDYGEKGFKNVKIETISFILQTSRVKHDNLIKIESYVLNSLEYKSQNYIFSEDFPYWLIYRNNSFDNISKKLEFNIFNFFRDRKITKRITKSKGKIRVLKSRNVGSNKIIDIQNYDSYIDDIQFIPAGRFINHRQAVVIPNLSYYPRASFLPKNTIGDGSVAILTLKNGEKLTKHDLEYFNTEEFTNFYKIARNFGTRSLNIDNNSIFYWGIPKRG